MLSAAGTVLSFSLAQAIARAEKAGFDVRVATAQAQAASAQTGSARSALRPQASVGGTLSDGGITQLGVPSALQAYLTVTASVPLYVPSVAQAEIGSERAADAASLLRGQSVSDEMFLTAQAYETALFAQATLDSALTTVAYHRRHVRDVDVMVRAGAAPRYLLAESHAALAQAERVAEDSAARRDESLNDLKFALAFEVDAAILLTDPLQPLRIDGSERSFQARSAQRPDVGAAEKQVAAAQARVASARAAYSPMVSASAQTYTGASSPALGTGGYQVGVNATLPVLDGGNRASALSAAQAELARTQAERDRVVLSAQRDVANAWREMEAARREIDTARQEKTAADESLRVSELRERAGKGIALETLDAIARDGAAREALLRAIARFNVSVAAIHHAVGDTAI